MSESARVTVERTLPEDLQQRQIIVSLDGERMATLLYGQTVTREVASGTHRLHADNTLFRKTLEFEAQPGQQVRFVIANRAGPGTWMMTILGAGPLYLTLERRDEALPVP